MISIRGLVCFGGLAALGGLLSVAACGSDGANADPGTAPPDGGAPGEGGPPEEAGAGDPAANGPFTFRDRLAGWSGGYTGGWYRAHGYAIAGKRLFSLPDALSPSLGAVTVVDVSTPKPKVIALPVVGKFSAGTVEAFVYEPRIDRIVIILRPLAATKVEIVTVAIGDTEATFTTLTQAGPISTSNSLIGPLFATGTPGVVVAGLGNTTTSFSIQGTTATWAAESQGTLFQNTHSPTMEDPAQGRVLSFGKDVYDAVAMKGHVEPNIVELSLAAPYAWSAQPFGGDAPPNGDGLGYDFAVYDSKGGRILASSVHDTTCGPMPCKIPGLWSFNLAAGTWTKLVDQWMSPHAYAGASPFIVDQDARRILEPSDGLLVAASLDPVANPALADVVLEQDGDLGPTSPIATTVLGDGRIVSTDGRAFRVLDPALPTPRWERFGTATLPSTLVRSATISADPTTGETLVFGGASVGGATPTSSDLYVLSKDGKTMPKITVASAPPPRASHGALVVDGTLYIAGGTLGTTTLDDVWAFDRASSQWTKIATLPAALTSPTLSVGANDELLVMGRLPAGPGAPASKSSPVFAVNRTTHAVRAMAAVPATSPLWSLAAFRGCFIGYEAGNTVDNSKPNVWRCSVANGATTWTSAVIDEHGFALNDLPGVTAPDGLRAYFVGRHLWEAIGK